jgi:hypothetical protein
MLEDNSTTLPLEVNTAEEFTGGYVYLTRIQTSKAVLWYAGKKHRREFDPTYFGSGNVVIRVLKKYGPSVCKTRAVAWAVTADDLNSLERALVASVRRKHGRKCVNISEGGEGFTPGMSRLMWSKPHTRNRMLKALSDPDVKRRKSISQKAAFANPNIKAKMVSAIKAAHARPEVKAKVRAAAKDVNSRPEVIAKRVAAFKSTLSRPDVKARFADATRKTNARPDVKQRKSAALKAAFADPAIRARISAAQKLIQARPEVKVSISAGLKRAFANPEVKARHSAATKAAKQAQAKDPAWQATHRATMQTRGARPEFKANCRRIAAELHAANGRYRKEWADVLKPVLVLSGIAIPKSPNGFAKAETWAYFVEHVRTLLATHNSKKDTNNMTEDNFFSQAMKTAWADPKSKFNSPEYKEKLRAATKERMPELSARMKAAWAEGGRMRDPAMRDKMSAAMKEVAKNPEFRAKVSAAAKARWAKRKAGE